MEKLLAFIVAAIIALTAYLISNNYLGNKFTLPEFYNTISPASSKTKSSNHVTSKSVKVRK